MARILLVEDEHDVRLLIEHVLLDGGHVVVSTDSAEGALKLLDSRRWDLLLADAKLGDDTGITVADRAKAHGIPTLIVTGYAFALPREDLARYDFLLKPVRPTELLQAIDRVLGQASQ